MLARFASYLGMKQFLITLIAVLVGGFLALVAYDRFIVAPREAVPDAAAPGPDLTQARNEAREIGSEVEASVERSLDRAREGFEAQAKSMDRRALVADAVQRATMFRASLTEYYMTNGRWPIDADEAGLPSSDEMRGGAVRSITVEREGRVAIALDDTFGADSRIVLMPKTIGATGQVEWSCEVKGDAELKQALPRCRG